MTKTTDKNDKIVQILSQKEKMSLKELAQELNISIVTLRRYLKELDEQGLIYKSYGFVHWKGEQTNYELPYVYRKKINIESKKRVAQKAVELLEENDSIFLDVGTSVLCLSEILPDSFRLSVITNWIPNILAIHRKENIQCFIIGSRVRNEELSISSLALQQDLSFFHIDKAFIAISGVSVDGGLSDFYDPEIQVKQEVLKIANEKILLADSSKFHKNGPLKVCKIDVFDKVIVDSNLEPEIADSIRKKGVELILA